MKEFEIFYNSNGSLSSRVNPNLVFCGENNSVVITVNFPEDVSGWEKFAFVTKEEIVDVFPLGSNNPSEFAIPSDCLSEGNLTIGFEVRDGDTVERFEPAEFFVSGFVNEKVNIEGKGRNINFSDLFGGLNFDVSSKILTAKSKSGKQIGSEISLGDVFSTNYNIPSKTSELINDSGFLTQHQSLTDYATKEYVNNSITAIPTKTSDLTNDSGFLTQHQDVSDKMSKISNGTAGDIITQDNNGNAQDSGININDVALKADYISKSNTISFTPSGDYNPATKKYVDNEVSDVVNDLVNLQAKIGFLSDDIIGVSVDYENNTFARLSAAVGLTAGTDFDSFPMFGGRRRCNVADDGTITAYYGDVNYAEDGSNGQVMVYQPKFYYMTVPIVYEKQETGLGYHMIKANYYVTATPRTGFKLHPAFFDENGNEVDYILLSAYEGSIYDESADAYLLLDEQIADFNNDKFCSIAVAKPASGVTQNLTRPNIELMAKNRGAGWHSDTIKTASANQYLMIIEMGALNIQTAIGQGIVSITDNASYNCSSLTGSTSALGNATGQATATINEINGTQTTYTTSGKLAITYRGMENPCGNVWKLVYGVNIWGDGTMNGGQPFICSDFNFAESKRTDNYEGAGFCLTNASGYVKAFGYSQKYDWLFLPSKVGGTSLLPVGDQAYVIANLNDYNIALLGGYWSYGDNSGAFNWAFNSAVGSHTRRIGGRLVYVPTAS